MNATMNEDNRRTATEHRWGNVRATVRWSLIVEWLGWIACVIALLLILFYLEYYDQLTLLDFVFEYLVKLA